MKLEIIPCQDRARWMAAFDRLPDDEKDIHWLPEYVDAHRQHRDGFAYVFDDGDDIGLITFVGDDHSVASPYGYGGAIGELPFPTHVDYRCHPLFGAQVGEVEKHVVVLDLDCDDLRSRLSKGHKAAVRRAEKFGLQVMQGNCIPLFESIYRSTMERQGAAHGWRFEDGHFARIVDLLGPERAALFFVDQNWTSHTESACLVLHGFNAAYYHFAGSHLTQPGANHLMVLRVAEWAQKQGYRWLHLGGGVTAAPDDPLLIFKKGFGGRLVPVHRYNGEANGAQAH